MISFYQQYNDAVLTSSLQSCFTNNITTSLGCLLIRVVLARLLQLHDMVEKRRDGKTTAIQRRFNAVCLRICTHCIIKAQITLSIAPCYLCHSQIFQKIDSCLKNYLNFLCSEKIAFNCSSSGLFFL